MPTTRRTIRRTPRRLRITDRAVDLFDAMQALEQACSCAGDIHHECSACKQWWQHHRKLHDELRLHLWEQAYSNFDDDDDPKAMQRYSALKAASDARKRAA